MSKRMIVGALAALATLTAAAPAAAGPIGVSGCYGVTPVIVCNPTVEAAETYKTTFEVCAGTCTPVEVTLARTSSRTCVSYTDRAGRLHDSCAAQTQDWYDSYSGSYGSETCSDIDVGTTAGLCYSSGYNGWTGRTETCVRTTGAVRREFCA